MQGKEDMILKEGGDILELDRTPYPTAILLRVGLAVPESQEPLQGFHNTAQVILIQIPPPLASWLEFYDNFLPRVSVSILEGIQSSHCCDC